MSGHSMILILPYGSHIAWQRVDIWQICPLCSTPQTNYNDYIFFSLRWHHNDHAGVSNHQPHGCLLNRLFRRKSKKTSKLRVTGLCAGNSPGTGEFPAQMASYAENVSIWWRHHVLAILLSVFIWNSSDYVSEGAIDKSDLNQVMSWWRHQMETFSALLAICAGNSPVTGEFPAMVNNWYFRFSK